MTLLSLSAWPSAPVGSTGFERGVSPICYPLTKTRVHHRRPGWRPALPRSSDRRQHSRFCPRRSEHAPVPRSFPVCDTGVHPTFWAHAHGMSRDEERGHGGSLIDRQVTKVRSSPCNRTLRNQHMDARLLDQPTKEESTWQARHCRLLGRTRTDPRVNCRSP